MRWDDYDERIPSVEHDFYRLMEWVGVAIVLATAAGAAWWWLWRC